MIIGLQITIRGEELSEKIAERIRMHEATVAVLDARIKRREGDQPFDIRADDGLETLADLEAERQHYRDRVFQLTLLRDNVNAGELYVLSKADLRMAELISPVVSETSGGVRDLPRRRQEERGDRRIEANDFWRGIARAATAAHGRP